MKRFPLTGAVLLLGIAGASAAVIGLQRQQTALLRSEIELRHEQSAGVARLRAENTRLRTSEPSPTEVQSLRATAAEVRELRTQIEKLKTKVR